MTTSRANPADAPRGIDVAPSRRMRRVAPRLAIGFPTRNEATTISHVASTVETGLRRSGLADGAVLINADNASADGTANAFRTGGGQLRRLVVKTPGRAAAGKGTNVLAIFHAALDLGVERVAVLDADVRSIEPHWVAALLSAVDGLEPAMAVPVYRRNRYEGNTTSHIANPLIAAVFGMHVQQPIAGDFAFNRAFIERAVTWPLPESAQQYGIDIHLTGNAARERYRITEVPLSRKIHNPGFPKILPMSQQVIDALMHVIVRSGTPLECTQAAGGSRRTVDDTAMRPSGDVVARTFARVHAYLGEQRASIARRFPSATDAVQVRGGLPRLSYTAWAQVLADTLTGLAAGSATEARDHLVALYLCRVFTYWDEIEQLREPAAIDALLEAQTRAVIDAVTDRRLTFTALPPMAFHTGAWAAAAMS